jgi:hypothetical protein
MKLRPPPAPPLDAATVAILLGGWTAKPLDGTPANTSAAFDLFQGGELLVLDLWHQHESFLRFEASRLNIEPTYRVGGRLLFFGEVVRPHPANGEGDF